MRKQDWRTPMNGSRKFDLNTRYVPSDAGSIVRLYDFSDATTCFTQTFHVCFSQYTGSRSEDQGPQKTQVTTLRSQITR